MNLYKIYWKTKEPTFIKAESMEAVFCKLENEGKSLTDLHAVVKKEKVDEESNIN